MSLRNLMINAISKEVKTNRDVALLFSGGTDSLTCLFSLLELDIRPTLYSFHLQDIINRDIEISKLVAKYYDLQHVIIPIKTIKDQLLDDVLFLIKKYKIYRKTNVQCTYPFLYVLPEIKENIVVTGLCADDLYGSAKSVAIKSRKDKEVFDKIRIKTIANLDSSAYRSIKELIEVTYGKKFVVPYRNKEIIEFFMKLSWTELNKPKQKQLSLDAFKDYFLNQENIYRVNSNLQVESKIREWHDVIINSSLNTNNRSRVDEIYKDIYREMWC